MAIDLKSFGTGSRSGYNRNDAFLDEVATKAKVDLGSKAGMQPTAQQATKDSFEIAAEDKPARDIFPTDVMNVKVELPTVTPVAALDRSKDMPDTKPQETGPLIEAQQQAIGVYQKMDQFVKGEFIKEAKNIDPAAGQKIAEMVPGAGANSTFAETAQLADPGLSDVYNALNSVANKSPSDDRVYEVMEKALSNLQKRTEQQAEANAKNPSSPPPLIDWTKFQNVAEVEKFMKRDISQDPFMQQAATNEEILEVMVQNEQTYAEYEDGRGLASVRNLVNALERGDTQIVESTIGQEKTKVLEQTGNVQVAMMQPAIKLDMADMWTSFDMKGGKKPDSKDITDLDEMTREVAKEVARPSYDLEPAKKPGLSMNAMA